MDKSNLERLQHVAEGLADLNEQVVYVGGSACGLYATDPAAADPRPTQDVDLRLSHDFEDVVYVLNYCPEFSERLAHEQEPLKSYLYEQFSTLAKRPNIREEIECALPMGEEERVDLIMEFLTV